MSDRYAMFRLIRHRGFRIVRRPAGELAVLLLLGAKLLAHCEVR